MYETSLKCQPSEALGHLASVAQSSSQAFTIKGGYITFPQLQAVLLAFFLISTEKRFKMLSIIGRRAKIIDMQLKYFLAIAGI
jgi:hypothetical protein